MNVLKVLQKVLDWLLPIGIITASVGLLGYMFIRDLFSFGIFAALCIFLYIGIRSLIEEKKKSTNH